MRLVRWRSAVSSGVRKNVSSASEGRSDHPPLSGESGGTCVGMVGSASRRSRASYLYGAFSSRECEVMPVLNARAKRKKIPKELDDYAQSRRVCRGLHWLNVQQGKRGYDTQTSILIDQLYSSGGGRSTGGHERRTYLSTHISPCSPLPSHLSKPSPIREPPFPSTFVKTSSESAVRAACGPRMMSASWATMKKVGSWRASEVPSD